MANTSHTSSTALTTTTTAPSRRRWTKGRQVTFLRALASTHSVAQAARAAGMSRQAAYELRARLKGEPFDIAWHAALQCRFDLLAEAALERALNGVEVPHFHKGELVGTSRRYDERLTVALLAMRERFAPPRPDHFLGQDYARSAFGTLLDRVETGPETWAEEHRLQLEARNAEMDAMAEAEEEGADDEEPFSWP